MENNNWVPKGVFSKMQYDSWPNVVMLNNGYWFVADEMKSFEPLTDTTFLEFEFTSQGYDFHYDSFEEKKCLNNVFIKRRISINVNEISFIIEYDS